MLNPLDLDQWEFYVVPTRKIDEICSENDSITLKSLENMQIKGVPFERIREQVESLIINS